MGKIIIDANVTLDGVGQDPDGAEGFAFGGWFTQISDADREAWAKLEFEACLRTDAVLLGGRTYEWFASRWLTREGAWAERLNSLPKYVVRSSAGRLDWGPTTVLDGDLVDEVTRLKQTVEGDIEVFASYQLVHALLEHDLADELRVYVFPRLAGAGGRLFGDLPHTKPLQLTAAETVGTGLVRLTYQLS
jgi:dihydrofolate reductase